MPAETIALVKPLLSDFGITRVANVSGLDRVGIPVFMVVRPNSRGLSVSQGKGVDEASARASGIMESIEQAHAEFATCPVLLDSFHGLRRTQEVADPRELPLSRQTTFHPHHVLPWTMGIDLQTGEVVWVPYELVHANATLPLVPGSGSFVRSTNGLASGNTLAEAILHAIYEVVERDALALWELKKAELEKITRVDLESISDSVNVELLARFRDADLFVVLWDVTSDIGIPCFRCLIIDKQAHELFRPIPAAFGSGCHLVSSIAISRALTEAAQSRLTCIAGARDDLSRARYSMFQSAQSFATQRKLSAETGRLDAGRNHIDAGETVADDIRTVCTRLANAGFPRVVAVNLSRNNLPISVVRVIIPGLEGPPESAEYMPGRRARSLFA